MAKPYEPQFLRGSTIFLLITAHAFGQHIWLSLGPLSDSIVTQSAPKQPEWKSDVHIKAAGAGRG